MEIRDRLEFMRRSARQHDGVGQYSVEDVDLILTDIDAHRARISELRSALIKIVAIVETQPEPDVDAIHDVAREALER